MAPFRLCQHDGREFDRRERRSGRRKGTPYPRHPLTLHAAAPPLLLVPPSPISPCPSLIHHPSVDACTPMQIAGVDSIIKTALMVVYDQAWNRVDWGKELQNVGGDGI